MKPVKLLTLWVLDNVYEQSFRKNPHRRIISNGIWETTGVRDDEWFTLTCTIPYNDSVIKGATVEMHVAEIAAFCHQVKIVHCDKIKL